MDDMDDMKKLEKVRYNNLKKIFIVLYFYNGIENNTMQHFLPKFLPDCYHQGTKITKAITTATPRDKSLNLF